MLAEIFDEPGADRVSALLSTDSASVGVSVLTLYKVYTSVFRETHSDDKANEAMETLTQAVAEVIPVSVEILAHAISLRRSASARLALADVLIAATAMQLSAVLIHRDPHFAALPAGLRQEVLPDKNGA